VIVLPPFLLKQWKDVFFKFTDINPNELMIYHGSKRHKTETAFDQARVVLTTYGVVTSDIEDPTTLLFQYKDKFDCLVIDEAHKIRNEKTILYERCSQLALNIPAGWLLTGTIIHNSIKDFMNLATFLDLPGFDKITTDPQLFLQWKDQHYYHLLKSECEVPLPEKHLYEHYLDFDSSHGDEYLQILTEVKEVYKDYQAYPTAVNYHCMLSKILRLRQCCNHPNASLSAKDLSDDKNVYDDPNCAKFEEIADLIDQTPKDDKVLIFSQWGATINLISKYLTSKRVSCIRYGGDLSLSEKTNVINQFDTNPDIKVLLITTTSGGVGLNLTRANHVIMVDSWWNYAVEEQAIDRVYRLGQYKDVHVHRLYMKDTIEQWMIALKTQKQKINQVFHEGGDVSNMDGPMLKQLLHNFI
jgi:SNF2 family DNA or RNA helicase